MSLKERVHQAVADGQVERIEELVREEPRAVRFLLGMTYQNDKKIRQTAARGVALAGKYHHKLVQKIVRRLVWAMNDESGTNAVTAPAVLQAISEEAPELLLPMVPDLTRLAGDQGLHLGLAKTLRTIALACPGEVGQRLSQFLNQQGGSCGVDIDSQ